MNVSLKVRLLCQKSGLFYKGIMTSGLYDPALMKSKGAETAGTKAAPVADQAEFYLPYGRNPSKLLIGGMVISHIRKGIYLIHLLHGKRLGRGILDHKQVVLIWFGKALSCKRIRIIILNKITFSIFQLICLHLVKGREDQGIVYGIQTVRLINRTVYKGDILNINPAV